MGTIDEVTGAAMLTGTGAVAGNPGVTCSFTGTVSGGTLMGTVSWGDGNELPCGTMPDRRIRFMVSGSRWRVR